MNPYVFVGVTVLSTVGSQAFFKLGVRDTSSVWELANWSVVAALLLSLTSILSWLLALSRLELATAYPFMSLTFPLVCLVALLAFGEQISLMRWFGMAMIVLGLIVASRG